MADTYFSLVIWTDNTNMDYFKDCLESIDGQDYREFELYILDNNPSNDIEVTIKELAELVKATVGYRGTIEWDATKPDGTLRKLTDVTKLHTLGWHHKMELTDGIPALYRWYLEN